MEHFLSSLAGCICILAPALAQELGMEAQGLQTVVEGTLDVRRFLAEDGVKPGFRTVRVRVRLKTREPQVQVDCLKEDFERRCPFHYMLKETGALVDSQWEAVSPEQRRQAVG